MSKQLEKYSLNGPSPLKDTLVIDTDVHITYNSSIQEEVAKHMKDPWAKYTHPDSPDSYPSAGWPKTLGGKRGGPTNHHIIHVDEPEAIQDPLCDGFGIDHPIINTGAPVDKVPLTKWGVEEMRGANNMLLDRFLDENDHFFGVASVATREPDKAAEELDRIGDEDQIIGAYLYEGEYMKPLGDPSNDIMWQAMEDNNLTPTFHVSQVDRKMQALRQLESNFEMHTLGGPFTGQLNIASLIGQGVPEKFPDLNFVFLEMDLLIVPLMMGRMNREYAEWIEELPLLEKSPEEYLRDQFYFATQPLPEFNNPAHMTNIIETIGVDSLVYSSDHPHYDFDTPGTLDSFLQQLSPQDREKVLHGNAIEAYDLPISA